MSNKTNPNLDYDKLYQHVLGSNISNNKNNEHFSSEEEAYAQQRYRNFMKQNYPYIYNDQMLTKNNNLLDYSMSNPNMDNDGSDSDYDVAFIWSSWWCIFWILFIILIIWFCCRVYKNSEVVEYADYITLEQPMGGNAKYVFVNNTI